MEADAVLKKQNTHSKKGEVSAPINIATMEAAAALKNITFQLNHQYKLLGSKVYLLQEVVFHKYNLLNK